MTDDKYFPPILCGPDRVVLIPRRWRISGKPVDLRELLDEDFGRGTPDDDEGPPPALQ
jgi:hypothetical protein